MPRETVQEKWNRLMAYEQAIRAERGNIAIAGMDEVGRGPLAGPVVAACICVAPDAIILGVDDSKKISERRRESLYPELKAAAQYCQTAWVGPDVIDQINILQATRRAMTEAASGLAADGLILIDAVEGLTLPCEAQSIVHGDATCYAIAAASIIAKVERDRYMIALDEKYPMYGFARNKGYGTAEHIAALRQYGPCPAHRMSFIRKFVEVDS